MFGHRGPSNERGTAIWLLPLIAGIFIGMFLHNVISLDPYPSADIPRNAASNFKLMAEAWNAIDTYYVDRPGIKTKDMTYAAISGMVDSLGDTNHSVFLTPEMVAEEHTLETGRLTGIGAEIQMKDDQVVVVAPLDGSPAQKAGLRPGDVIVAVDGAAVEDLPLQTVVQKIGGPAGSVVTLTVKDPTTQRKRDLAITRATVTLPSVTWELLPGLGMAHVRIAFFSQGTSKELGRALAEIEREKAKGLILDLRNNPGGLLSAAVGVASRFLESGTVLQEKNAKGMIKTITVESKGRKYALPVVVLINSGTASASEIVAGAFQDAKRARLVGEKTFGTGTVLEPVPLSDGSALLLAVREWLTPKGRVIWHKGITPDVAVPLSANITPLMPQAEKGMTPAQLRTSKDRQLLRAIGILRAETPAHR
jgi:carboxyl-terminal processing protease